MCPNKLDQSYQGAHVKHPTNNKENMFILLDIR